MTARVALILNAEYEPPKHEQGIVVAAVVLRDHVNLTTANSLSIGEADYIVREVVRAYLRKQL